MLETIVENKCVRSHTGQAFELIVEERPRQAQFQTEAWNVEILVAHMLVDIIGDVLDHVSVQRIDHRHVDFFHRFPSELAAQYVPISN